LLATAFYQLLVKTRQDRLGVNSFQLLHYQAPQSAFLVLACTPLFDKALGPHGFLEVSEWAGWVSQATGFESRSPRHKSITNLRTHARNSSSIPWARPRPSFSPASWPTA